MKCERCGHGVGLTRRGQAIADGYICYPCLDELGFDKKCRSVKRWALYYWEIKDGPNRINYNRAARKGKHEDWLREHSDAVSFIEALDEDINEPLENEEESED